LFNVRAGRSVLDTVRQAREDEDGALLRLARDGDPGALDALIARHHGTAYRVALSILGSEADPADATQDGVVRGPRRLQGFRGDSSFRTWLLTIVANEARSLLRRSARRREAPMEAEPAWGGRGAAETVARDEELERARALLARLPEKQRLAVQLRV